MPALVHLQPPTGASRIALTRFSPYFERPELGFEWRRPAPFYRYVYDLPDAELADLAYFFDSEDRGISGSVERALTEAIEQWKRDYPSSSLFRVDGPDEALIIRDRRRGWPVHDHVLTGWARAAYNGLDRPRTAKALQAFLADDGHDVDPTELHAWIDDARRNGLVFTDNETYVALATRNVPVRATRSELAERRSVLVGT
jgi:hypothetical protein